MLNVLEYHPGSDKVLEGSFDGHWHDKLVWIDASNPTPEEESALKVRLGLVDLDFRKRLSIQAKPGLDNLGQYTLIMLSAPDHGGAQHAAHLAILLGKQVIVTLRRTDGGHAPLAAMPAEQSAALFRRGATFLAFKMLEEIVERYFVILEDLYERLGALETQIMSRHDEKLIHELFHLKKVLIFYQRAISGNRDVLGSIEKGYGLHIDAKFAREFRFLYMDSVQLLELVSAYRELITSNVEILISVASNDLNKIIKRMTAWGTIILLPSLIAGIYGMNFRAMPELHWQYGYPFAWGLIILSVIALYIYFKAKDWF